MNYFERYKQIISRLQELGSNIAYLKHSEWMEFNNLNEERAKLDATLLNTVKSRVAEADEAITFFKTRIEDIKNSLEHISGPDGTPGDIIQLESIWRAALTMKEQISSLGGEAMPVSAPIAEPGRDMEQFDISHRQTPVIPQPAETLGQAENNSVPETAPAITAAKEEAAAAAEPVMTDNTLAAPPGTEQKTPGRQKDEKASAGPKEKASTADKKAAAGQNKIIIPPAKSIPAKKEKQNKKGSGKHPPLTIIPTKNITCGAEEILLEEIKKNLASIKQGKG